MKFSVLLSIYHKEQTNYFNRAMLSIYDEQSVKPDEIVLVEDGPLTTELYEAIDVWKVKLGALLIIIPLEKNVGLGDALNIGLSECMHDLVARMDTDDIAYPYRFEKQLELFETSDVDICSGWISEFDIDENIIVDFRKLPETHEEITIFSKLRCPINHPAVMYKKSSVEKAGGYQRMISFEDYYLWGRMLLNGAKFYNLQIPLVNMRTGNNMLARRRGFEYAKREIRLMKRLHELRFISLYEFIRNITIRSIVRIVPARITKIVYKFLR
jgi:glycosyltransferase involved in cell wall biosynthesis